MRRTWIALFFLSGGLGATGCEKIVGITDDLCPEERRLCLAHRYSFDDSPGSTGISDSVGGAPGETANQPLLTGGAVLLERGQYVMLPPGIISSLGDEVTIEVWVSWKGSQLWERVFDFGNGVAPQAGGPVAGSSYLFLTPFGGAQGVLRAAVSDGGFDHEKVADAARALPTGEAALRHVAVVVSYSQDTITLYLDGALVATGLLKKVRLSLLEDVNNWLGRSQYAADPPFEGTIAELRLYSAARTPDQVSAAAVAGPETLPAQ
jgi:hypothetical protein